MCICVPFLKVWWDQNLCKSTWEKARVWCAMSSVWRERMPRPSFSSMRSMLLAPSDPWAFWKSGSGCENFDVMKSPVHEKEHPTSSDEALGSLQQMLLFEVQDCQRGFSIRIRTLPKKYSFNLEGTLRMRTSFVHLLLNRSHVAMPRCYKCGRPKDLTPRPVLTERCSAFFWSC